MILTSALLFAFGAMLCWGVGDFLIQRTGRRIGSLESLALIAVLGAVMVTPFVRGDLHLLAQPGCLLLLFCLGLVTFTAGYLDFEALRTGKLAVIDVIIEFELPVTISLAIIAFHERLSAAQWTLIVVIFLGIVLIALESGARLRAEKGALLALLVALLFGFVNFFTASSSRFLTPLMAIWLPWIVTGLLCLGTLAYQGRLRSLLDHSLTHHRLILAMVLVDTAAWICYAYAVHGGEVSILTAITESYPVVAMLLGVWLNKERLGWHQYLGGALAIGACIALAITI